MTAPTVIQITNGTLTLADTEAELETGGENFECQVTSAAINATPNLQTVPATFCEPESQSPSSTGYELAVTWLQDWTAPGGGLSYYAFQNDTLTKWFSLSLDTGETVAIGQTRIVAGSFGGDAGTPLTSSTTWPLASKPNITVPAAAIPPDPNDLSGNYPGITSMADLATLKADATLGDTGTGAPYNGGTGTEAAFTAGQYVTLDDASQANWDGTNWQAGAMAAFFAASGGRNR